MSGLFRRNFKEWLGPLARIADGRRVDSVTFERGFLSRCRPYFRPKQARHLFHHVLWGTMTCLDGVDLTVHDSVRLLTSPAIHALEEWLFPREEAFPALCRHPTPLPLRTISELSVTAECFSHLETMKDIHTDAFLHLRSVSLWGWYQKAPSEQQIRKVLGGPWFRSVEEVDVWSRGPDENDPHGKIELPIEPWLEALTRNSLTKVLLHQGGNAHFSRTEAGIELRHESCTDIAPKLWKILQGRGLARVEVSFAEEGPSEALRATAEKLLPGVIFSDARTGTRSIPLPLPKLRRG